MTCSGCSDAVSRVLGKLGIVNFSSERPKRVTLFEATLITTKTLTLCLDQNAIEKVDIDLKEKKVTITTTLSEETILEQLKKSGKAVKVAK